MVEGDEQPDLDQFFPEDGGSKDGSTNPYGFSVDHEDALERAARTAVKYRRAIVSPQTSAESGSTSAAADGADQDEDDDEQTELQGLAGRIIDAAGAHPGKYDPPVALSTHILNAVVVGVNAYVYDTIVRKDEDPDSEEAALLIAGLALHDTNKFVDAAYDPDGLDTDDNSTAVLDYYFDQGDPFGIEPFLRENTDGDTAVDIADVKWLVQRTETKEKTNETEGESTLRVRGLEKYCRIGDGFVSKQGDEGLAAAADWLEKFFSETSAARDGPHVQLLTFSEIEQSVLNNHLLATVKEVVEDPDDPAVEAPTHGVLLGSTPDAVLYLGAPLDRATLQEAVADGVMQRVTERHDFNAKTEWNSFEYDILAEIDIPFDKKRTIIAEGYADTLRRGSGTDHEFESVPEAYKDVLPELARTAFREQNYDEAFANYPTLKRLWEEVSSGEEYSSYSQKIGFLAELLRRHQGAVEDGYDPADVRAEVTDFAADHRDDLRADLEPESEAGAIATRRFFEAGLRANMTVPSGDSMCFLCGRPAEREYKKGGDAFYKTQSFSRRVPAEGEYKRICPVCNLEHALLRDLVEATGYSIGSDIKIAFVYYDEFVGNLTLGTEKDPRRLVRFLDPGPDEGESMPDVNDPALVASSFVPQYHLHPFYADSENARLRVVRELLETFVSRGFKIVIGKPFAGFRPQAALLSDLNPTRRQTTYGADRIGSFAALERTRRLFDILRKVADSSDYSSGRELTSIQRDGFQPVADLVARESERYETVRQLTHQHFTDDSYPETRQYMMMREVAREGLNVYGQQYNSRYKKTKVFRLALDATLDSLNSGKEGDELHEYVAGQVYKSALEEDYAGRVTTDQVTSFVDTLLDFLQEDGSLDKQTLSRRRNTLTNAYLFAYDRLLDELQDDDEETEESATATIDSND
jgi:CRISPR-associated protein Csc3